VSWGQNKVDQDLLRQLLNAKDYKVRAAAVEVVRFNEKQLPDQANLLLNAAKDENSRVRLEAVVAASWLPKEKGLAIEAEAAKKPLDSWMIKAHKTAVAHLEGHNVVVKKVPAIKDVAGEVSATLIQTGKEIYLRDGFCNTCHQPNGKGLAASGFPPLTESKWVLGNEDRLIKIVLKGIYGPIVVNGKKYPGQVPMTPYGGLLNDKEVAAVLTYIRNSFGNKASAVDEKTVKRVREEIKNKVGFYSPDELLLLHPMEQ
jgi:mono/diheme cytochrome c family protein